jgi:hypothetical protein
MSERRRRGKRSCNLFQARDHSALSATIRGQVTADDEEKAAASRISIEPVSLQDLIAALGIHTLTSALTTENR